MNKLLNMKFNNNKKNKINYNKIVKVMMNKKTIHLKFLVNKKIIKIKILFSFHKKEKILYITNNLQTPRKVKKIFNFFIIHFQKKINNVIIFMI